MCFSVFSVIFPISLISKISHQPYQQMFFTHYRKRIYYPELIYCPELIYYFECIYCFELMYYFELIYYFERIYAM